MYFNYHATIKKLLNEGKLVGWYITDRYHNIAPALVLIFNDFNHHTMPVRKDKWYLYEDILPEELRM